MDGNGLVVGHNIQFIQKNDILDSENLFIQLTKDEFNVKVVYELTNHGKEEQIKYVFPVKNYFDEL